jgi:solute carrier family 25 iron transporter 28/37
MHGSEFRSGITAAKTILRTEGIGAFYISYPTTLTMTVPFTAVQFSTYEFLKDTLNPSGSYSPLTHVTAGGLAGGIAAAVTTPLDVAKTLLQTRGTSRDPEIRHAKGMFDALRIIGKRDGPKGFLRGVTPRVVTFMPSNALCWLSYEFFSEFPKLKLWGIANPTRSQVLEAPKQPQHSDRQSIFVMPRQATLTNYITPTEKVMREHSHV